MVLLQADGNGHLLQMHADQRAADVKARVGLDLLQCHGMAEAVIGGGGKGAAGLGLGHHVDDLAIGDGLMLHDEGAVQMLAALGGDVDAHGSEHAVQALEDGIGHFGGGPTAHVVAHHLAGGAAHHHDLALVESGDLGQLTGGVGGFFLHLYQKVLILYVMNGSCHKKHLISTYWKALCGLAAKSGSESDSLTVLYHSYTFSAIRVFWVTFSSTKPMTSPMAACTKLPGMLAAAPIPLPSSRPA